MKSFIIFFIKSIVEGVLGWFSRKRRENLEVENATLQEALNTVSASYKQQQDAQGAANEAAENAPNVEANDGGIDFSEFNNRS